MVEINTQSPESSAAKRELSRFEKEFTEYHLGTAKSRDVLPKELFDEVIGLHKSLKEEYEKENPDPSLLGDLTLKLRTQTQNCFSVIRKTERERIDSNKGLEKEWKNDIKRYKAYVKTEDINFGVQKLAPLSFKQGIIDKELYDNYKRCTSRVKVGLDNPDVPLVVQAVWLTGVKNFQEEILKACKQHAKDNPATVDARNSVNESAAPVLERYTKIRESENYKDIPKNEQRHATLCHTALESALQNGDEPIIFLQSLRDQLSSVVEDMSNKIDSMKSEKDDAATLRKMERDIDEQP